MHRAEKSLASYKSFHRMSDEKFRKNGQDVTMDYSQYIESSNAYRIKYSPNSSNNT